jgi:hypothetical protein
MKLWGWFDDEVAVEVVTRVSLDHPQNDQVAFAAAVNPVAKIPPGYVRDKRAEVIPIAVDKAETLHRAEFAKYPVVPLFNPVLAGPGEASSDLVGAPDDRKTARE